MEFDQWVDLAQYLTVFSVVIAPPVISLVKNIGGSWPTKVKQGVSFLFAVAASLAAIAASGEWSMVNLGDVNGFWVPFALVFITAVAEQYASYKLLWSAEASRPLGVIEAPLANAGAPPELKIAA